MGAYKKLWKELLPTPCPGTHNRGMCPHRGVVNALLCKGKPTVQVLLVDVVVAELCHLTGIKTLEEMKKKLEQANKSGLLPTPNTLDSLEPKKLESIVEHNQKARPGRSYLSMNLREKVFYGQRSLEGAPLDASSGNGSGGIFGPLDSTTSKIAVRSGKKCLKLYESSTRHNSLLKVCVSYLLSTNDWYSNKCALVWGEKLANPQRLLYQLSPKNVAADGEEESLFLTPTTQEVEHTKMDLTETGRRKTKDGKNSHSVGLMDKIAMLNVPNGLLLTPSATNIEGGDERYEKRKAYRESIGRHYVPGGLAEQVKMLPTPATRDWKGARKPETLAAIGRLPSNSLEDTLFSMLPTPTTSDGTGHNRTWGTGQVSIHNIIEGKGKQPNGEVVLSKDAPKTGLKLQPTFVEWMMGYPQMWTNLSCGEAK